MAYGSTVCGCICVLKIYEVFVEMSLACQCLQQVLDMSGVQCPGMCWEGGWMRGIILPHRLSFLHLSFLRI